MSELEVTRVMSDLRGLYERGKLSDEQIARLDAIGFNWERQKRIKPTLDSRLAELWDEEGMVPDDATVAYISTLDRSREERAFELAKHDYYGFLDYKEDRYTTVYGYMD